MFNVDLSYLVSYIHFPNASYKPVNIWMCCRYPGERSSRAGRRRPGSTLPLVSWVPVPRLLYSLHPHRRHLSRTQTRTIVHPVDLRQALHSFHLGYSRICTLYRNSGSILYQEVGYFHQARLQERSITLVPH